jgi:hypothetical protein
MESAVATEFAALLLDAFPSRSLPVDCDVERNLLFNHPDCDPITRVVTTFGGRNALIGRLRRVHPVDRDHRREFDEQLWDVVTEATAFAWTANRLAPPTFTDDHGRPDIFVEPGLWVEAKRIGPSATERPVRRAMAAVADQTHLIMRTTSRLSAPHATFLKKFSDGLTDALGKARPTGHRLLVFFEVAGIDFGTRRDIATDSVVQWAGEAARTTACSIVITGSIKFEALDNA